MATMRKTRKEEEPEVVETEEEEEEEQEEEAEEEAPEPKPAPKKKKATTLKRRKKAAPKEEEEAPKKATLSTRAIDPAKVVAAAQRALGGGGGGTNFLKLNADETDIRIYPGEPVFLDFRQNTTRVGGRYNTTMSLDSLFNNPELHNAALEAGKVDAEDFAKFQQFGDPFVSVMMAVKNAGIKLAQGKAFWPATKALMNVIKREDDTIYLWECSKTALESISKLIGTVDDEGVFKPGKYPELLDAEEGFDITVEGNGKDGKARRYTGYIPAREASVVGDFSGEPYDLLAQALRRVATFDDRARQLFGSHGDIAQMVGITPDTWGLATAVIGNEVDDSEETPDEDPSS
jgi:FtsZ-interacting cell division protein YlmF